MKTPRLVPLIAFCFCLGATALSYIMTSIKLQSNTSQGANPISSGEAWEVGWGPTAKWLAMRQRERAWPSRTGSTSDLATTALVASALALEFSENRNSVLGAADWITSQQKENGQFGDEGHATGLCVFFLLSLCEKEPQYEKKYARYINRAVRYGALEFASIIASDTHYRLKRMRMWALCFNIIDGMGRPPGDENDCVEPNEIRRISTADKKLVNTAMNNAKSTLDPLTYAYWHGHVNTSESEGFDLLLSPNGKTLDNLEFWGVYVNPYFFLDRTDPRILAQAVGIWYERLAAWVAAGRGVHLPHTSYCDDTPLDLSDPNVQTALALRLGRLARVVNAENRESAPLLRSPPP